MLWSLSDYGLRIIQHFSFCGLAKKCWDVALRELQCPLFLWTSREDSVGLASARLHWFRQHVTWLILPVVICLSQRLSHACLSISVSLRNCEWLIKTVIVSMSVDHYLDIHGNSRANTCVQTRLLGRVVLIRHWTIPCLQGFEVIDGNRTNRMLRRRWFIQVSDLSASDGRVLAYRGFDG